LPKPVESPTHGIIVELKLNDKIKPVDILSYLIPFSD